jgi:hypothetical protein
MNPRIYLFNFCLILVLGVMICTGCRKDENNPPEETYDLVTSKVIGPEGGIIRSNDVKIEFPAGAFSGSESIELYSSSTENPFGDDGNSAVFWLKGLPDNLTSSVKVSLRYRGTLSDESYICIGKPVIATSGVDSTWSQSMVLAEDSSGFLQASIPAGSMKKLKSASYTGKYGFPLFSTTGYWYYKTDHFMIHFPSRYKSTGAIESLADGLEGSYDTLLQMGFTYNGRTSWPLEVTVKQLPPEVNGQANRSFPWTSNSGYLEISTDIMNDKPLVKITGAHEFFHIVQDLYNYDEQYNWLQEASSVWFEEKFSSNPTTYASDARAGHQLEPFSGLQAGSTGTGTHHGYGCSAVIKYAVSQYGDGIMKKIWEYCRDGEHPVEAIKLSTDPYVMWYINFMREYVLDKVYSDNVVGQMVYNDKFTINSDQDIQKSFERPYPDLSGYVYIVEPKNTNFKDESKLQLDLTGTGGSMYVLKKTGSSFTSIGYDIKQLVIPDLKGLQSSGSILYVLVTNYLATPPEYTSTSTIKLDMSVVNAGNTYINNFTSTTDPIAYCLISGGSNFLIDVKCTLTSTANDFRITKDSTWPNNEYKWMELYYLKPQVGETKTLHANVVMENLRKNPLSGVTWDPYIYQVSVYVSDKNGQNTIYMDGSGNYSFDINYDNDHGWPFASVTVTTKDVLNQGWECYSTVCWINLFAD